MMEHIVYSMRSISWFPHRKYEETSCPFYAADGSAISNKNLPLALTRLQYPSI